MKMKAVTTKVTAFIFTSSGSCYIGLARFFFFNLTVSHTQYA